MSIVRRKLSRLVLTYLPFNSSLSEKAIAWTTKSRLPHALLIAAKVASMLASSVTSQGVTIFEPTDSASGCTRFSSASP